MTIVGPGGLGGAVGGLLASAGANVTFLCETKTEANRLECSGLFFQRPFSNAQKITADYQVSTKYSGRPDVLLLAVKSCHTGKAIASIAASQPRAIGSLQNGLSCFDDLMTAFPGTPLLGCVSRLTSERDGDLVTLLDDKAPIWLQATEDKGLSGGLAEAFRCTGVTVHLTPSVREIEWCKLVSWIPQAVVSVALDLVYPDVYLCSEARRLQACIAHEIVLLAQHRGITLKDYPYIPVEIFCGSHAQAETFLKQTGFNQMGSSLQDYVPSMLKDVRKGVDCELSQTAGEVLAISHHDDIPMPNLRRVFRLCQNRILIGGRC